MIEVITAIVKSIECIEQDGSVSSYQGIVFSEKLPANFKPILIQKASERNLNVT